MLVIAIQGPLLFVFLTLPIALYNG